MKKCMGLWVVVAVLCVSGCSKDRISRSKLKGHTYSAVDVAIYYGIDYSTWLNEYEGEPTDNGEVVSGVTGTLDLSNPDEGLFELAWTEHREESGVSYDVDQTFSVTGEFDMKNAVSDAFWLRRNSNDHYFAVYEKKGRQLTVVWKDQSALAVGATDAVVAFAVLERD